MGMGDVGGVGGVGGMPNMGGNIGGNMGSMGNMAMGGMGMGGGMAGGMGGMGGGMANSGNPAPVKSSEKMPRQSRTCRKVSFITSLGKHVRGCCRKDGLTGAQC